VLELTYTWAFYRTLKSGLLIDFYFKYFVQIFLANTIVTYGKLFGDKFLLVELSFKLHKNYNLFFNFLKKTQTMSFEDIIVLVSMLLTVLLCNFFLINY